MKAQFTVSVIIPTYNRPESVMKLLDSLSQQTLPPEQFEVIVVDDGSTYDDRVVTERPYPFKLRYIRQENSGATIARNNGARGSQGEQLVFIDDDITVSPGALQAVVDLCLREPQALVMGTLISRSVEDPPSPFTNSVLKDVNKQPHAGGGNGQDLEVNFSWCNTQLLAMRRDDFFGLGMLQDPTGGWPNWDDVDLGYRAYLAGYRLLKSGQAVAYHWDNSLRSLEAACNRWQRACKSAVRLLEVHPGLLPHLPMLRDKTPVVLARDSPRLVVRKLLRQISASKPVLWCMEQGVRMLERLHPSPVLQSSLYLWIQGSYMYRGYREGLRERERERRYAQ